MGNDSMVAKYNYLISYTSKSWTGKVGTGRRYMALSTKISNASQIVALDKILAQQLEMEDVTVTSFHLLKNE
jgi:hypothetical protein